MTMESFVCEDGTDFKLPVNSESAGNKNNNNVPSEKGIVHMGISFPSTKISPSHQSLPIPESSEKKDNFVCPHCSRSFQNAQNLKRHIQCTHENPLVFDCHICDRKFSYQDNLNRHVTFTHYNPMSFKCNLCQASFNAKSTLDNHLQRLHTTVRRFNCPNCSYATMGKSPFSYHAKKCLYKNNQSEFEDKISELLNEVRQQTIICQCSICEMVCPNISALLDHINSHNDNAVQTADPSQIIKPQQKRKAKRSGGQLQDGVKFQKGKHRETQQIVRLTTTIENFEEHFFPKIKENAAEADNVSANGNNSNVDSERENNYSALGLEAKVSKVTKVTEFQISSQKYESPLVMSGLSLEMRNSLATALKTLYDNLVGEENFEMYGCKLCSVTCLNAAALENHMKRHL